MLLRNPRQLASLLLMPLALLLLVQPAAAACIDRYPINECPEYGRVAKTTAQRNADKVLLHSLQQSGVTLEQAHDRAIARGWQAMRRGDPALAMRRFNQAWLIANDSGKAFWGFAAVADMRDGDVATAERYFARAIAALPGNADLRVDVGRFYGRHGRPRVAIQEFTKALAIRSDARDAHRGLAVAHFELGEMDEACRHGRVADTRGEFPAPGFIEILRRESDIVCE